jgi:hypothetical protein
MKYFAALLISFALSSAIAAESFRMENYVLLQPDQVLRDRAPSVQGVSDYLKAVTSVAQATTSHFKDRTPTSGFIVVAVRPGSQSKAWTDFLPALSPADEAALIKAVEVIPPFEARNGTVLTGARISLWGAARGDAPVPNPPQWRAAFKASSVPMEVTDMVDKIWSPRPAPNNSFKPNMLRSSKRRH